MINLQGQSPAKFLVVTMLSVKFFNWLPASGLSSWWCFEKRGKTPSEQIGTVERIRLSAGKTHKTEKQP